MKSIIKWFLINNLLLSLPLYFYSSVFSLASIIFISFYSFLWFTMNLISGFLIKETSTDSDIAFISFAVNIVYKFLLSLLFLGFVIYVYKTLDMKYSVLLFVFYYFQYSFLIAKYGKNKVI